MKLLRFLLVLLSLQLTLSLSASEEGESEALYPTQPSLTTESAKTAKNMGGKSYIFKNNNYEITATELTKKDGFWSSPKSTFYAQLKDKNNNKVITANGTSAPFLYKTLELIYNRQNKPLKLTKFADGNIFALHGGSYNTSNKLNLFIPALNSPKSPYFLEVVEFDATTPRKEKLEPTQNVDTLKKALNEMITDLNIAR